MIDNVAGNRNPGLTVIPAIIEFPVVCFAGSVLKTCSKVEMSRQQPSGRPIGPKFRQCRLARTGGFGHRFKKFRLPHRLALPGRVDLPAPRFGRMPFVFDRKAVINGAES
jgi:hypothetical protein